MLPAGNTYTHFPRSSQHSCTTAITVLFLPDGNNLVQKKMGNCITAYSGMAAHFFTAYFAVAIGTALAQRTHRCGQKPVHLP